MWDSRIPDKDRPRKVFIAYAKENKEVMDIAIDHLMAMQTTRGNDVLLDFFQDTNINNGKNRMNVLFMR